jgi:hypothetical protein
MDWSTQGIKNSFFSMLGANSSTSSQEQRMDEVRDAMLEALGEEGKQIYPVLYARVSFAQTVEALWYMRSDLMVSISALRGEAVAGMDMQRISAMFKGGDLSPGLQSRPSPLGLR